MRFPGQIKSVLPGLGRILSHRFDLTEEIKTCQKRLQEDAEVVAVMNMPGWQIARREYGRLIENQLLAIRQLCKKTKHFTREIQERSDLMEACEMWLQLMTAKVEDYEQTAKRQDRLRRAKETGVN